MCAHVCVTVHLYMYKTLIKHEIAVMKSNSVESQSNESIIKTPNSLNAKLRSDNNFSRMSADESSFKRSTLYFY